MIVKSFLCVLTELAWHDETNVWIKDPGAPGRQKNKQTFDKVWKGLSVVGEEQKIITANMLSLF